MDEHHRGACALVTLTFAFILVGCAAGSGQSATPTTSTPTPTATGAPSAPASPEPTILPTPTAATGRLGVTWRAVTLIPPQLGVPSSAVTAGGPGWIALASAGSVPTAWTSVDGTTWQPGASLPLPAGITSDTVSAMTSFGTDVYGVGVGGPDNGAIVWRSKEGGAWAVIGSGALFDLGPCPAGCASAKSIAAGPAGIVLAGYRLIPVGSRFDRETDLWSSLDGTAWVRTPAPVPAGSSDKPAAEITVAAVDQGFIAAGSLCDKTGTVCRSVTWASADGRRWAPPVNLPDGTGVSAQQLAVDPDGAVILGMRCTDGCRLVAWCSADGVSWAKADLAGAYVEGSTELAAAGDTFVLVTSTDDANSAAWTSTDGRHWLPEVVRPGLDPALPLGQILELAGRPGSVLAMGLWSGGEKGGDGLWVSP